MRRLDTVFVLGLVVGCLAVGRADAISIDEHVTTLDPRPASACATPTARTSFATTDADAFLWLHLADVASGDQVEWRWFSPGNAPYATSQYAPTFTGSGCAWSAIVIPGTGAATLPGQWRVDVYLDGALATTSTFTIVAPSPPPAGRAAQLSFSANEQTLVPWAYEDLRYKVKAFQPGLHVDVYLALREGGSGTPCPAPETAFTSTLAPFATDVPLANTQAAITAGFLPDQLGRLTMTLYGVLVAHGKSPADPANWVSNLAALDLAMGPLSSRQLQVLAERGNPQAWVVQFLRDSRRRIETWTYPGGVFQFINGSTLATGGENQRASASTPTPPTAYDPGRFQPGTTPVQIRGLLGDPDRVVSKPSGVQAWIFKRNRMTVTIQNGVVREIAAY
jgi:hypothetical protein